MSTFNAAANFNPTTRVVEPSNRPDQLAEAVLASLSRGRWGYKGRPWGVVKTAFLSFFTLGLLPLLCWPRRMRNFMSSEQQQLWLLADWLRLRTGKPEAVALRDQAARDVGPVPFIGTLPLVIAALCFFTFVRLASRPFFHWGMLWNNPWNPWTILLFAGYAMYWLQICRHAAALEKFVAKFNSLTAAEGIEPVTVPPVGIGLELPWIIAALLGLCFYGALWSVPLALAGAVQTRYVWVTSRQTRADLSRRVRVMLGAARPVLNLRPTPRAGAQPCPNQKCHATIRPGATFCPRCGTRIA